MQISQSKITVPHRIHELKNVPQLHGAFEHVVPSITTECNGIFGERPGKTTHALAGILLRFMVGGDTWRGVV
jgi:hypothetical protein